MSCADSGIEKDVRHRTNKTAAAILSKNQFLPGIRPAENFHSMNEIC
jgi:hypothetical protein